MLIAALNAALLVNQIKKLWSQKTLALLAFAGSTLIAALSIAIALFGLAAAKGYLSAYIAPFLLTPFSIGAFALLHWRARYASGTEGRGGFFSLQAPLLALALLCTLMLAGDLSQRVLQLILADYYWEGSNEFSPGIFLMGLEQWVAYLICPVLALKWLPDSQRQRGRFYALCVIWSVTILFSVLSSLLPMLMAPLGYFWLSHMLDQNQYIYVCGIILFMVYLSRPRVEGHGAPQAG